MLSRKTDKKKEIHKPTLIKNGATEQSIPQIHRLKSNRGLWRQWRYPKRYTIRRGQMSYLLKTTNNSVQNSQSSACSLMVSRENVSNIIKPQQSKPYFKTYLGIRHKVKLSTVWPTEDVKLSLMIILLLGLVVAAHDYIMMAKSSRHAGQSYLWR